MKLAIDLAKMTRVHFTYACYLAQIANRISITIHSFMKCRTEVHKAFSLFFLLGFGFLVGNHLTHRSPTRRSTFGYVEGFRNVPCTVGLPMKFPDTACQTLHSLQLLVHPKQKTTALRLLGHGWHV